MAIIYRKTTSRPLTEYQKRMNTAAQQLCLKNPALLRKRQLLNEESRKKILEEGFQFVKGKTRSKKELLKNDGAGEPKPKRQKMSQDVRDTLMKELEEMIKDYDERISFKEQRITASLNISDYKACDEIKDAVMGLKKKRRELEAEMKRLKVSNRQSRWYFHKKSGEGSSKLNVSGSSSTPSEQSPLAYDSSSDIASSSESTIGSEGSSVPHRAVSESPVYQKSDSKVSPVLGSTHS